MSYEKQKFVDGQVLKAEHLEAMEDAIIANEEAVDKLKKDIDDLKENGSGLNETSSKLLIKVLRNGLYAIDLSEDINTLETELGANIVRYAITNNLTNATNSNTDTSIKEGFSYSASIVASNGYILSNVTVTMGGTDITSEVYSGGVINIPSVSGDIVINAIATISQTTMYSITNTFTNVSTDNPSTSVEENGGYSATLTPNSGYLLESVTVTMGGVDITSSAYANGVVTISSVTGNVVITAIASEPQSEEVVLLKSITGDGASYIDTEFIIEDKTNTFELSASLASATKVTLFGADGYNVGTSYGMTRLQNTNQGYLRGELNSGGFSNCGTWNNSGTNSLVGNQWFAVIKDGSQAIYLDAEYTTKQANATTTSISYGTEKEYVPIPLYLFTSNRTSSANASYTPCDCTIYFFKISNSNGDVIHEYLPARQGTKIGMYDTVTQKFHENKGTGTFSYEEVEA